MLYHFMQKHTNFSNRYKRLLAMSVTLMLWSTILTSRIIWSDTYFGLRPWVSWENVHLNWNHVNRFPWAVLSPQYRRLALLCWWEVPVSTVIAFIFLGFGVEALEDGECNRKRNIIWPPEGERIFWKRDTARTAIAIGRFEVRTFHDVTIQPLSHFLT